jgi:hypothetical protein
MARLIPLFFLMIVAAALFALRRARQRNRATYRPRAAGAGSRHGKPGVAHVMTRAELSGVRDAYSSATIDPSRPLTRCGSCQAVYHRTSFEALRTENAGRCAICGSTDLGPVTIADQHDA